MIADFSPCLPSTSHSVGSLTAVEFAMVRFSYE
jgi:hypothetical protein